MPETAPSPGGWARTAVPTVVRPTAAQPAPSGPRRRRRATVLLSTSGATGRHSHQFFRGVDDAHSAPFHPLTGQGAAHAAPWSSRAPGPAAGPDTPSDPARPHRVPAGRAFRMGPTGVKTGPTIAPGSAAVRIDAQPTEGPDPLGPGAGRRGSGFATAKGTRPASGAGRVHTTVSARVRTCPRSRSARVSTPMPPRGGMRQPDDPGGLAAHVGQLVGGRHHEAGGPPAHSAGGDGRVQAVGLERVMCFPVRQPGPPGTAPRRPARLRRRARRDRPSGCLSRKPSAGRADIAG